MVGICIGSLAAAAISCTRSLSELLPVAVQAVGLSFRAGLLASDVSRRFCAHCDQSGQSWAFKSLGLSTDGAVAKIDEFSELHVGMFDGNFDWSDIS
jgi:noranthrone synthase